MSENHPPTAAVEATKRLVEPLEHPVPCDTFTAAAIASDLGYFCDDEWLTSLQAVGCFPPVTEWDYPELAMLFAALEFRERWQTGHYDSRKSRSRLFIERRDVSLVDQATVAAMKFDSEALLSMLHRDARNMTDAVRSAVIEVLRFRMGLIVSTKVDA